MLSIKVVVVVLVLVSTSLVFILLKLFDQIPELMNYYYLFAVDVSSSSSDLSSILNVVASWLRPPYLYLVINCIIITIVATSKLQPKFDHYAFSSSSSSPPLVLREPLKTTDHHDDAFDQFSFSVKSTPVYGGGVGKTSSHDNIEEEVFDYASNYSNYYVPTINDHHHADDDDHVDKNINDVVVNHGQEEEESEKTKILMDSMVSNDPSKLEKVLLVKAAAAKDYNYNYNNNYYYYAAAAAAAENIDDYDKVVVGLNSNKVVINRAPSTASEFSKPPASSRFGHRKVVKATTPDQGGKALRVSSKAKRQETLESTWKTITDGRPMPLTRHLRKYDTWETTTTTTTHPKDLQNHSSSSSSSKMMTKSQTFSDRSSSSSININRKKKSPSSSSTLLARSSGKLLKKDPSLGQDELNKRVEAFITKFNEDMRLQRQESINQYMEMINRGAAP